MKRSIIDIDVERALRKAKGERDPIETQNDIIPEELMSVSVDGGKSLDALADSLLDRISKFFGECLASDEKFCGFGIDELRDAKGKLLSFTLVPCDLIGGDAVRRKSK